MKRIKEFLTERNMTIDAKGLKIGHGEPKTDDDFLELAQYGDQVYEVYIQNYGDKAPKTPWSSGMTRGRFEDRIVNIIDSDRLDVHCALFLQVYVFVRLKGEEGEEAIRTARDMYESKIRTLGF